MTDQKKAGGGGRPLEPVPARVDHRAIAESHRRQAAGHLAHVSATSLSSRPDLFERNALAATARASQAQAHEAAAMADLLEELVNALRPAAEPEPDPTPTPESIPVYVGPMRDDSKDLKLPASGYVVALRDGAVVAVGDLADAVPLPDSEFKIAARFGEPPTEPSSLASVTRAAAEAVGRVLGEQS